MISVDDATSYLLRIGLIDPSWVVDGCLSIQGVLLPVERPAMITIAGQDEHGADVRYELEEPYSRVAQHELDHLDGVLILDRTTPEARREALAALRPRIVLS